MEVPRIETEAVDSADTCTCESISHRQKCECGFTESLHCRSICGHTAELCRGQQPWSCLHGLTADTIGYNSDQGEGSYRMVKLLFSGVRFRIVW